MQKIFNVNNYKTKKYIYLDSSGTMIIKIQESIDLKINYKIF